MNNYLNASGELDIINLGLSPYIYCEWLVRTITITENGFLLINYVADKKNDVYALPMTDRFQIPAILESLTGNYGNPLHLSSICNALMEVTFKISTSTNGAQYFNIVDMRVI